MDLVTIIGGIIVLVFLVIAIVYRMKTTPSLYDKNKATEFLNGMAEAFYYKMLSIVSNIDFNKYESLADLEADVIKQIYDTVWDYAEEKMSEAAEQDIITAMVLKALDKDRVLEFIDGLVKEKGVIEEVENLWAANKLENDSEEMLEDDAALQEQFADSSQYCETSNDEDLAPVEEVEDESVTYRCDCGAIQGKINVGFGCSACSSVCRAIKIDLKPQVDEEPDFDPSVDDPSVELVDSEDSDIYHDKNGRLRSKSTGRFV